MELTSAARRFLQKSFFCFIAIENQLNRQIKSVKILNRTCNDFWRWLFEFKMLPSYFYYETHCANLEKWLNMLKDLNKYSSNTSVHELTEDQIKEMKIQFDDAYKALKDIILY